MLMAPQLKGNYHITVGGSINQVKFMEGGLTMFTVKFNISMPFHVEIPFLEFCSKKIFDNCEKI